MFDTDFNLYGLMLIIALLLNAFIIFKETYKYKMPYYETIGLLLFENCGILLGAKILAFLQQPNTSFLYSGFSSYGGVAGAIISIVLFSILVKENIKPLLCICFIPMPLVYGIGKIGCFFAGCCYGIEYSGVGNIVYECTNSPIDNVELFPIQILETIVFILIFIFTYVYYLKHELGYLQMTIITMICVIAKFAMYYLRNESVDNPLGSHQIICIVLIIISTFIYLLIRTKKKKGINV